MVLVIVIPILALTALTIVVIVQALEVRSDANESKRVIDIFHDIDHIVTALGVRRDSRSSQLVTQRNALCRAQRTEHPLQKSGVSV